MSHFACRVPLTTLVFFALLLGCTFDRIDVVEDRGQLCLRPAGEAEATLPADQPLELAVLGSFGPHHEPISAACSATVQGNQLHVQSQFVVNDTSGHGPALASSVYGVVSCPVEALGAGDYEILFGNRILYFTVPFEEDGDLLECWVFEGLQIDDEWRF